MKLNARIPEGRLEDKWSHLTSHLSLIHPNHKGKYQVLVVGSGLAGASAAAALGEQGYQVGVFLLQDSPRRSHSVTAQGGINAAKNYANDGDSIYRLFEDTLRGGDYQSREANVYRLAEISPHILDLSVAQGAVLNRTFSGYLDSRAYGGTQVSRTFFARGQTGQQLLQATQGAMNRQVQQGQVHLYPYREMVDLVVIEGRARGIIVRNRLTGTLEAYAGHAVVLGSGGYGNLYYQSTNPKSSNASALWKAYLRGAGLANPSFVQIHPTCIPPTSPQSSKLTLMSESLRNHGRIWTPLHPEDLRSPQEIPHSERDYFLERQYPDYGNLVPRDIATRCIKEICDQGKGVARTHGVYLDMTEVGDELGDETVEDKYGNLFHLYHKITGDDPRHTPMTIYPAVHYTMGGLWVDYHLMTTIPGLFAIGECNFSDHGANRLGSNALLQGVADGGFILPQTVGHYLAETSLESVDESHPQFDHCRQLVAEELDQIHHRSGDKTTAELHCQLGAVLWEQGGILRYQAGLQQAQEQVLQLDHQFWHQGRGAGSLQGFNPYLESSYHLSHYLHLAHLLLLDAEARKYSCGAHYRRDEDPEANPPKSQVAVWFYQGRDKPPSCQSEPLHYQWAIPRTRNYS